MKKKGTIIDLENRGGTTDIAMRQDSSDEDSDGPIVADDDDGKSVVSLG